MSAMLETILAAWKKAWSDGETSAFAAIVADDYIRHSKSGEESLPEMIRQIEEHHRAFSEHRVEIIDAIEDKDSIAIHWRTEGKHTGEYLGVPATGRVVSVVGATFLKYRDEKITEESVVWDPRDMLAAINIWHLGSRSKSQ